MKKFLECVFSVIFVPYVFITLFFRDMRQEAQTILKSIGEMFSNLIIGSFKNDSKEANKKTRV